MSGHETPPFLLGFGEPFAEDQYDEHFSIDETSLENQIAHARQLEPQVVRLWLNPGPFMRWNPSTNQMERDPNGEQLRTSLHKAIALLETPYQDGLVPVIVGMASVFPNAVTEEGTGDDNYNRIPCPLEGDKYLSFLARYQKAWKFLTSEFTEINQWEEGNEFNGRNSFKPGHREGGYCFTDPSVAAGYFTWDMRARISTDLMIYSYQGIQSSNPDAFVWSPGWAPVLNDGVTFDPSLTDLNTFLSRIFSKWLPEIYPDKSPADLMDGAAWHPYFFKPASMSWGQFLDWDYWYTHWAYPNQKLWSLFSKYYGPDVRVFFSEMGYSDCIDPTGDPILCDETPGDTWQLREYQASAMMLALEEAQVYLKPLWGFTWFRLFDDPFASWNAAEEKFGLLDDPGEDAPEDPQSDDYLWKSSAYTFNSFRSNWPSGNDADLDFEMQETYDGCSGPSYPTECGCFTSESSVDSRRCRGGYLWAHANTSTPVIYSATIDRPIRSGNGVLSELEISTITFSGTSMRVAFQTSLDPSWSADKEVWIPLIADGRPHTYTYDLTTVPKWMASGADLTKIRIVPTNSVGDFGIDSIRILNSPCAGGVCVQ